VEDETSAWSSRLNCHARIATAMPTKAISSFSLKLSHRRLGGRGGGRWRLCLCCRWSGVGGADGRGGAAGTDTDGASHSGAGNDGGGEGAAADERRRSGRRRVNVAARGGAVWRGCGAMKGRQHKAERERDESSGGGEGWAELTAELVRGGWELDAWFG
jgi:hypothetical protein